MGSLLMMMMKLTCTRVTGFSLSAAVISNISPPFVPARIFSPPQQTLRTESPKNMDKFHWRRSELCSENYEAMLDFLSMDFPRKFHQLMLKGVLSQVSSKCKINCRY